MITVMSTTSKVMFGYTVFVSSFSYLTTTTDNMGGGVLSSPTWDLFPLYVSTQYYCTFFFSYFYELANAFSKLSTTVLLCLEVRLQEKVEERSPSPLP